MQRRKNKFILTTRDTTNHLPTLKIMKPSPTIVFNHVVSWWRIRRDWNPRRTRINVKNIVWLSKTWIVIWQNSLKTNSNSTVINASVNQEWCENIILKLYFYIFWFLIYHQKLPRASQENFLSPSVWPLYSLSLSYIEDQNKRINKKYK